MINIPGFPYYFGVAVFIFEGNGVVLNLESSMKHPEQFKKTLNITIVCLVCIIIAFASMSYDAYGTHTKDIITLNLPHENLTSIVQLFYCLGLLCTYPIMLLPAISIVEKTEFFDKIPTLKTIPQAKVLTGRTLHVLLTGVLAVSIPKFGLFINLIGALSCTCLVFVFPVSVID